jgi:anti-sigma B factor antagonist
MLALKGEIDIATAEAVELEIHKAIIESVGDFVIDLSRVEFLDSSGLAVLMRARGLLGAEDRALALVCPPGPARRALEVSGLEELFTIYESGASQSRRVSPERSTEF